jgi:ubiquinone/menaquinone biosynthesis C-methylase UbiE
MTAKHLPTVPQVEYMFQEDPDSFLDMMLRKQMSNIADQPTDFYIEGLRKAQQYTKLTKQDVLLDVGASSGQFVIEAAQATHTPAYLVGLDRNDEPYRKFLPGDIDRSRFSFIKAAAENIPLPDDAVKVATAHNVLFRADDVLKMLNEMKRVVEPEGLIVVSTNGKHHAFWRHMLERLVAIEVHRRTQRALSWPRPPAESCYLENMPDIITAAGGLALLDDSVVQSTTAKINSDTVDDFLLSIKLTFNRTGLAPEFHRAWRNVVDELVQPFVAQHMISRTRAADKPFFGEKIHRGMFVLRNKKETPASLI